MDNQTTVVSSKTLPLTELTIDDVLHQTAYPVIVLGRYVHCVWYVIGFTGNVISAVIWNTNHMYDICSTAHYLVTLTCCDVICQLLHVFYYLKAFWRVRSFDEPVLCELWSLLYMIPLYISELLVLGFTAEKLVSIRNPFRSGWFNRHQRAPKEIVWIVVSVTVLAFPQAYFWQVDNRGYCDHHRKTDHLEFPIWHWVIDIFIYIVTPLSVVVLNCVIVSEAKDCNMATVPRKHDAAPLRQSTLVLLRLSFYRVVTLLPTTVIYFMEFLDEFSPSNLPKLYTIAEVSGNDAWERYKTLATAKLCADIVSSSRNAVSVFIFAYTSKHFQKELFVRLHRIIGVFGMCVRTVVSRVTHNLRTLQEESDVHV